MSTKIQDLSSAGFVVGLQTQSVTAVTTSGVTTTGYTGNMITADGLCNLLILVGTMAGTTPSAAVSVQESTDGTTWTGVTTLTGSTTCSSSNTNAACSFERTKQYLRTITTTSGTSASIPYAAVIVEQKKTL